MISIENVTKYYRVNGQPRHILKDQSLYLSGGYSYGLLGVNGAGKSTTIRLLAGIELPNKGVVRREARVSWPLGFSTGFNMMMSGRENLKFVARAYGENPDYLLDFVADFAEIGAYINQPVRTYSSGMIARFAFGLSMAIDFDCYLVDEITAVGDSRFQKRCEAVFQKKRAHSDLIMVSHDMTTISRYCDRGLVLVDGELIPFERVDDAVAAYMRLNK